MMVFDGPLSDAGWAAGVAGGAAAPVAFGLGAVVAAAVGVGAFAAAAGAGAFAAGARAALAMGTLVIGGAALDAGVKMLWWTAGFGRAALAVDKGAAGATARWPIM